LIGNIGVVKVKAVPIPWLSLSPVNPLLSLDYIPALESLGDDFYDLVAAAAFPSIACGFATIIY
jgi:hypothetical protein